MCLVHMHGHVKVKVLFSHCMKYLITKVFRERGCKAPHSLDVCSGLKAWMSYMLRSLQSLRQTLGCGGTQKVS